MMQLFKLLNVIIVTRIGIFYCFLIKNRYNQNIKIDGGS